MSVLDISSSHIEGFERMMLHKNKETGQLTTEHNLWPWDFEQAVRRPDSHKLRRYCQ